MRLNCYNCKDLPLKLYKLDYGLPALRCKACEGTYVDLLTYRMWLEDNSTAIAKDTEAKVERTAEALGDVENTETGILCQRCNKYMEKYRVDSKIDNTINVCHTCDDVWFDKGEWQLLKTLGVLDKLTDVMSEQWQNSLKQEEAVQSFKARYEHMLASDFAKVEDFANWLEHHEHREDIRHYLSRHRPW